MSVKIKNMILSNQPLLKLVIAFATLLSLYTSETYAAEPHNPPNCKDLEGIPAVDSIELFGEGSYKESGEFIEECISKGSDPPPEWIRHRGRSRGAYKGISGVTTPTGRADGLCPPSTLSDLMKGVCEIEWPNCHGTPGGIQGDGGVSCEDAGQGLDTPAIGNGPLELEKQEVSAEEFICMLNLSGGINVGANNSICLSGSAGLCGFDLGGQICLGGDDGRDNIGDDRYTTEGFSQHNNVKEVVIGEGINETNPTARLDNVTIFPEGGRIPKTDDLLIDGTLSDGSALDIEAGAIITFNGSSITITSGGNTVTIEREDGSPPEITATAGGGVILVSTIKNPPLPEYAGK